MLLYTPAAGYAVEDAVTTVFNKTVAAVTPLYPNICTIVNSATLVENFAWLGDFPSMREWKGERVFHEIEAAGYSLQNKTFESSYGINKEAIEDDRLGFLSPKTQMFAQRCRRHPDKLLAQLIEGGGVLPGVDDVPFFSDAHPNTSGAQSNLLEFEVADPDNVTPAEALAAFEAALDLMQEQRDESGEPVVLPGEEGPRTFEAWHPPKLRKALATAFTATVIDSTTNDPSARPLRRSMPYFSDKRSFYLFHVGDALRPFVFLNRRDVKVTVKGMNDREYKELKVMADARYNVGFGMWQHAIKITFVVGF